MTSQTHLLPPHVVASIASDGALTEEAKVQALATALALEAGGPLAQRLMSVRMPECDPCSWSEIQEAVAGRRTLLRGTDEWHAAERALAERPRA